MIYYVEDEKSIRDLVVFTLCMTGFEAEGFANAAEFDAAMKVRLPELILLDIMLPDEDGMSILAGLKRNSDTMRIPVIMLTAKVAEYDKVSGLGFGADDYVTKPFSMMELIARIKAVLRRSKAPDGAPTLSVGKISLDPSKHRVFAGNDEVALTLKEFELLRFLMENEGKAFDRETLLNAVWSIDYIGGTRTVDVHIQTLRKKLGVCGDQIETIYGLGYKMGSQVT